MKSTLKSVSSYIWYAKLIPDFSLGGHGKNQVSTELLSVKKH